MGAIGVTSDSRAINSNEVGSRSSEEGAEIRTTTPEQLSAYIASEIDKWAGAVKLSGARLDWGV